MGNTTMVSKVIKHVNRDSSSSSYDSKSTSISSQQSTTSLEQEKNVPLRLYSVREKLRSTGFSEKSIRFITNSWRPSTNKKYNFVWTKWNFWCNQWNINPMQPTFNQLINYLSELAENNYSYNTINAYKAAITQTLSVSGNFSFHQNPLMVRFMKGAFFNNRPKPKYTSTWDVSLVFNYLKSLYPLEKLDLKNLTMKLASLIALTTAQRVQTLISLTLMKCLIMVNTWCSLFLIYKRLQDQVMIYKK